MWNAHIVTMEIVRTAMGPDVRSVNSGNAPIAMVTALS